MKREFLNGLMEGIPKEVVDAIMEENGRDIQAAKESARQWEERYNQAMAEQEQKLAKITFDARLREEISSAGGRNIKAITALLDTEALLGADEDALRQAVAQVKKDCTYLFQTPQVPPYAPGTGAQDDPAPRETGSLADALREKFGG